MGITRTHSGSQRGQGGGRSSHTRAPLSADPPRKSTQAGSRRSPGGHVQAPLATQGNKRQGRETERSCFKGPSRSCSAYCGCEMRPQAAGAQDMFIRMLPARLPPGAQGPSGAGGRLPSDGAMATGVQPGPRCSGITPGLRCRLIEPLPSLGGLPGKARGWTMKYF